MLFAHCCICHTQTIDRTYVLMYTIATDSQGKEKHLAYRTEIVIALIALLGSAIGSYSGFRLTAYRVEQLEIKVDKHNNFATRIPLLEEKCRHILERIEKIEQNTDV